MNISDVDKNFAIKNIPEDADLEYFDVSYKDFTVFGLIRENDKFCRIPESLAKKMSEGVYECLYSNTSGGRLCFTTNSPYVALAAKMPQCGKMPHFTTLGSAGFDLYIDSEFKKPFMPDYNIENDLSGFADLEDDSEKNITINFPLYSDVSHLIIGLKKGAYIKKYNPYKNIKPIVYYGSSITQGACASRPGNSYQAEIARETNVDFVNLGFSGHAFGEKEVAEYIAGLDMSIFVMDYDHNAPTVEHLKNTHEKFFRIIREKNKDLPIVFVSKPDYTSNENENIKRNIIIYTTYKNAIESGDKNVYFVDGRDLWHCNARSFCTVDSCHPNDLGLYLMSQRIGEPIKRILNKL